MEHEHASLTSPSTSPTTSVKANIPKRRAAGTVEAATGGGKEQQKHLQFHQQNLVGEQKPMQWSLENRSTQRTFGQNKMFKKKR